MFDPGAHTHPVADKKGSLQPLSRAQLDSEVTTTGTTALNSAVGWETKTGPSTNVASLREFCVKNSTTGTNDEFRHPEEKRAKGLTHFK